MLWQSKKIFIENLTKNFFLLVSPTETGLRVFLERTKPVNESLSSLTFVNNSYMKDMSSARWVLSLCVSPLVLNLCSLKKAMGPKLLKSKVPPCANCPSWSWRTALKGNSFFKNNFTSFCLEKTINTVE